MWANWRSVSRVCSSQNLQQPRDAVSSIQPRSPEGCFQHFIESIRLRIERAPRSKDRPEPGANKVCQIRQPVTVVRAWSYGIPWEWTHFKWNQRDFTGTTDASGFDCGGETEAPKVTGFTDASKQRYITKVFSYQTSSHQVKMTLYVWRSNIFWISNVKKKKEPFLRANKIKM